MARAAMSVGDYDIAMRIVDDLRKQAARAGRWAALQHHVDAEARQGRRNNKQHGNGNGVDELELGAEWSHVWRFAADLAACDEFDDILAKQRLVGFALTQCPSHHVAKLLRLWQTLNARHRGLCAVAAAECPGGVLSPEASGSVADAMVVKLRRARVRQRHSNLLAAPHARPEIACTVLRSLANEALAARADEAATLGNATWQVVARHPFVDGDRDSDEAAAMDAAVHMLAWASVRDAGMVTEVR